MSRPACAPGLVHLYLNQTALTRQHLAVAAFGEGKAGVDHFDVLLDCADLLLLAAQSKKHVGEREIAHLARTALANTRDRYITTKELVVTGEELKALKVLVGVSEDFWKRRSGTTYNASVAALTTMRKAQRKVKG